MNKTLTTFFLVSIVCACVIARGDERRRGVTLPTGTSLSHPAPGFVGRTNSFPATIASSPDGRYAALLNQGYGTEQAGVRQSIAVLDLQNGSLQDFTDDRLPGDEKTSLLSYFIGLAFSSDGRHLYASMSSTKENGIAVYRFQAGRILPDRFITIPGQPLPQGKIATFGAGPNPADTIAAYPAGFWVLPSSEGDRLLVANNLSDNVVLIDIASGQILKSLDVSVGKFIPSVYPYSVIANKAGTRAWVSLWNGSAVAELDLISSKVRRRIPLWHPSDPIAPGTHPTTMVLNRNEDVLYVALSNAATTDADGVVAVDLGRGVPFRCYRAAIDTDGKPGASPIGIALNHDETRLYATSASLNAVAVFAVKNQIPRGRVDVELPVGLVPTEWYPRAIAVAGGDLLVSSAKGQGSGPNNAKAVVHTGVHPNDEHPYIATLIGGSVQRMSLAEVDQHLSDYTRLVRANNIPRTVSDEIHFAAGRNPIRHVIYVLKENRTYDQILGDLPAGDGDPSLTLYGTEVTPNQHKLALQFGVIDNFYDSGDVSANGHLWSDASATSDAMEVIWPILYRRSDRPEDFGNPLEQGIPDLDDPGTGFLWDNLQRHHFTYRIYGEMLQSVWCRDEQAVAPRGRGPSLPSTACPTPEIEKGERLPSNVGDPRGGPSPWPWPVPRLKSIRATKAAQRDHIDPLYADFAIDYPDQLRADELLREFQQFVDARGTARELPQFIQVWLPNDHTGGTRPGRPSPRACVADNDLALGRIVAAVSQSPYWEDTAIFVVEDDAQDGADHVDAHRSTALVISKYSPRSEPPFVDRHFYTTVSMIHTMENLLGLPAMNVFDEHSQLMAPLFAGSGSQPPYEADYRNLHSGLIYEMNSASAPGSNESSQMDFSRPDVANAQELNAILWRDAKARRPTAAGMK